jgi:glycerol-1-phosphate dehydrogenase [NAD(P)+]
MSKSPHPSSPSKSGKKQDPARLPVELKDLMKYSTPCGCGRTHSVDVAHVSIRDHAIEDLPMVIDDFGRKQNITLVVDRVTREIAGNTVQRMVSAGGHHTSLCVVPDGLGARPHADESALTVVEDSLRDADLAIAVGSGTINDLVKLASFKRSIPYIAVATAPSMNGYTSAIAAITIRGVKRTIDCHQPYSVVADLEILCRAPRDLVAAGLGDLESKPTATADFRLGGRLRGTYYCPAPERVVKIAEERAASCAEGINRRDREAITALTEALILSGLSMKLAGSSSPASGGEHLMSHYWDMTAAEENRLEGWHGAQVGVCTMVTAALYERLRAIPADAIDIEDVVRNRLDRDEIELQIRRRHGPRGEEIVTEFFAKHLENSDLRRELEDLKDHWDEIWHSLDDTLRPAHAIRTILKTAGAPITVQQIGLTPEHLKTAFLVAREIRGRFTVLDLADDLGLLEKLRDEVVRIAIE